MDTLPPEVSPLIRAWISNAKRMLGERMPPVRLSAPPEMDSSGALILHQPLPLPPAPTATDRFVGLPVSRDWLAQVRGGR